VLIPKIRVFRFAFDPPHLPSFALTSRIMAAVTLLCRPAGVLPKLSGKLTVRLLYHTDSVTVYNTFMAEAVNRTNNIAIR